MKPQLKLSALLLAAALCGLGALGQNDPASDTPRRAAHRGGGHLQAVAQLDTDRDAQAAEPGAAPASDAMPRRNRGDDGKLGDDEARPRPRRHAEGAGAPGGRRIDRGEDRERGAVEGERGDSGGRDERPRGLRRGQGRVRQGGEAEPSDIKPARRSRLSDEAQPARVEREGRSRDERGDGVRGLERRPLRLRDGEGAGRGWREREPAHGGRSFEARRDARWERRGAGRDAASICPRCGQPLPRHEGRGAGAARRFEAPDRAPGRRG